jgi:hypothetical protein
VLRCGSLEKGRYQAILWGVGSTLALKLCRGKLEVMAFDDVTDCMPKRTDFQARNQRSRGRGNIDLKFKSEVPM